MTSPSPPPVRKLTPNASPYMRYLIWMRRLALSLAVLLALWTPHGAQAQGPDPRIDATNIPSALEYPGQPFDVEVWASNAGTDAEGGGSITISLPEGHDLSILDASVQILPEDWSDCAYTAPHAWVVKPDSPCNRALQHNTDCKGQIDVRYPLAETWHKPWRAGEQHYIRVRVFPHENASRITVYVRVAMRAGTKGCDLRLEPDERSALATDQQGFPVKVLVVAVSTPTPTRTPVPRRPTRTPTPPTPTSRPVPARATPTPTAAVTPPSSAPGAVITPAMGGGVSSPPISTPRPSSTGLSTETLTVLASLTLCLFVIAMGGLGFGYLRRQQPAPQPAGGGGPQPQPAGGPPQVSPPPQGTCPHCGTSYRSGARFCANCGSAIGIIGGRYQVSRRLGQGGMGSVYLVQDMRIPGKQWAIKEMSDAALPTPAERQQAINAFRQEAQLLATLDHANLPRVVDFFSEGGCHYLVMDFIEGETLEQLLSRRTTPFTETEVLSWAGQLCDVLSYLHAQHPPVIFRDLKPDNIMLARDGCTKLIDFGIARLFKPGQSKDTTCFGTPGYAPPEQYGQGQTDARSDIYALGVTLHHLLTGYDPSTTPFALPKVRQLNLAVSVRTEAAIERATQRDPAHRFQTVAEMKQALGI